MLAFFLNEGPARYQVDKGGFYVDVHGRRVTTSHIRSDRLRRFVSRPNTVRELQVLPGVSSLSAEVVAQKCWLAEEFRKKAQQPAVRDGFKIITSPLQAYPIDTAGLRTVSAQMTPELCIRADNRGFVSVPTLTPTYCSLGIGLFFALFGSPAPAGFTFRRDTSTGPYTFEREPDKRVALFHEGLRNTDVLAELAWAVTRNNRTAAASAAKALAAKDLTPSSRVIRRYQVDGAQWEYAGSIAVPTSKKVRDGEDWLGHFSVANKNIELFGVPMLRARSRAAWSMSAGLNMQLNLLIAPMRKGMLDAWPRLFYPLEEETLLEYIDAINAAAASYDAKNCDQHHPPWAPVLFACLMEAAGYSSAAAWLEFFLSFGPVVQTNDHVGAAGMSAFGLPDDPFTWLILGGNKSGISTNELKNKWLNLMDQIRRGMHAGYLPAESWAAIQAELLIWANEMRHAQRLYMWSGGDNILTVGGRKKVAEYRRRLLLPREDRFIFDYSEDASVDFDGREFVKLNGIAGFWASVKRAIDKVLNREYGWDRKVAPATGLLEILNRIESVHGGPAIAATLRQVLTALLRSDISEFLLTTSAKEAAAAGSIAFNLADLVVYDDASKLIWKPGIIENASEKVIQHFLHTFTVAKAEEFRQVHRNAKYPSFIDFTMKSMSPKNRRFFEQQLAKGINRHAQSQLIAA